jgi:hypothetical protein
MKPIKGAEWDGKRWILPAPGRRGPRSKIRNRSTLKARQDRIYAQKRKWFLADPANSACPIAAAGLIPDEAEPTLNLPPHHRTTTEVHHKRGRGQFYLDEETWLGVSSAGHAYIHANPKESLRRGWMLSKITKIVLEDQTVLR